MALPKIDLPKYKLYLNSIQKEIVFRPFIVKEEKLLLMALESDDFTSVLDSIKHVINNCVLTENIDVDALPLFEIEYIFLNLRARSMGETVDLTYICGNILGEDEVCKGEMPVTVNMLEAALEMSPQNTTIMLTDNVGIKLKYPTIEISKLFTQQDASEIETTVSLIEQCTECLFDSDQVYDVSDMQEGEFLQFIEELTQDQFKKIQSFFDNIPKLKYETKAVCQLCGKNHDITLEGILDFFE